MLINKNHITPENAVKDWHKKGYLRRYTTGQGVIAGLEIDLQYDETFCINRQMMLCMLGDDFMLACDSIVYDTIAWHEKQHLYCEKQPIKKGN